MAAAGTGAGRGRRAQVVGPTVALRRRPGPPSPPSSGPGPGARRATGSRVTQATGLPTRKGDLPRSRAPTGGEGRSRGLGAGGWSPRGHGRAASRAEARGERGSRLLLPEARPRRRPSAHPLPPVARLASNRRKGKERPGRCRRPRPWPRPIPPPGPAPIPPRGSGVRRTAGAGPRGCPGDAQRLCSEKCRSAAMAGPQPCQPRSVRCRSPSPPEPPLRVKVVGLFKSASFQIAKSAAESLKNTYPSKFEDPVIVPLQEFAWDQYLLEKKRELKNEVWEYSSYVMCFVNDQLLGDALDLQKWAHKIWDIIDFRPPALYEALTVDFSTNFLRDTKHDFVFLDIAIDFYPIGRLIFELYCDVCPKTCKNFQVLCTGIAGFSQSGFRLHYAGSIFHRIVRNGWIQGGDIVAGKGDGGESIYGPTFEDENFTIPHNKRGVLGMVNKGRHSNGSQFYITLQPTPYLDRKYVAFGQLIEGTEVLQQLELVPTENERPTQQCIIIDSGDLYT
ncbi:probable inactive peptidyl-prolyl cis-trans isomerase-like 6 isoform X1 [Equus caballus]|uniref:probable inactive peptidyl-prolyl cis-trans isomerase-like 6 isoform X1 n=1 Tax=Equus caballus TaxID=9796 RepID=UPI0038B2A6A2